MSSPVLRWFAVGVALRLGLGAALLLIGLAIEDIHRRPWSRALRLNAVLGVGFYVMDMILAVTIGPVLYVLVAALPGAGIVPLPFAATGGWPATLAGSATLIAVGDFFYYWMHRAEHRYAWLWSAHAVHHSDAHMHVSTARRAHWLELPLQSILVSIPMLYVFGPTPAVGLFFLVFSHAFAYFTHLDVPLSLGRWNWLITTPASHRVHHSIDRAHWDKNFAMFLPIWDVLLGTYHPPDAGAQTGVHGVRIESVRDAYHWPHG